MNEQRYASHLVPHFDGDIAFIIPLEKTDFFHRLWQSYVAYHISSISKNMYGNSMSSVYSACFLDAFLMEKIPLTRKRMPVRIKRMTR